MRHVTLQARIEDGHYFATGHEEWNGTRFSIVAEGASWDELKTDVEDVVQAVYFDTAKPDAIHLHLIHDEELLVA